MAQPHLLQGPTIDAMLDICEELQPGLLIMGSRGLGPVGRLGRQRLRGRRPPHAVPVLVVRGADDAWPPERAVAGDDGSEAAGRAAEISLGIGGLYGAEEVLVRAHRNPPQPIGGWSGEDRRKLEEARSKSSRT